MHTMARVRRGGKTAKPRRQVCMALSSDEDSDENGTDDDEGGRNPSAEESIDSASTTIIAKATDEDAEWVGEWTSTSS